MEFYFPAEFGEQLAFGAAAVSAVIGLFYVRARYYAARFRSAAGW